MPCTANELLSKFRNEVDALEAQHLKGRQVSLAYDHGRPASDQGRLAASVSRDPTYTAYYSIRLFELWNDLLRELVDHVDQIEPGAKKPQGAKRRFKWYVGRGLLAQGDDCWRQRRNRWVHEGEMPDAESFAELLARVRQFLEDAQASAGE